MNSSPSCGVCDIYVTARLLLQMNHSELELGEPISLSELPACQLTAPPLYSIASCIIQPECKQPVPKAMFSSLLL